MNLLLVWVLRKEPSLTDGKTGSTPILLPLVTVIVAAKDEERHLEESVRSVLASNHPAIHLILINDRSKDRTFEIMERLAREDTRITVLSIRELPQGWTGKTHAIFQAAGHASEGVLLFSDADAVFRPDTISKALEFFLANNFDMISLLPGFTNRGLLEDAIYPHLALGLSYFYPLTEVNDSTKPAAVASGCFIMISRSAYHTVGTWETFKDQLTEDVALAKAVKANGLKMGLMRGGDLIRTRPFESLSEVCSFWRRTFYGALERSIPKIMRLIVNYVSLVSSYCVLCVLRGSVARWKHHHTYSGAFRHVDRCHGRSNHSIQSVYKAGTWELAVWPPGTRRHPRGGLGSGEHARDRTDGQRNSVARITLSVKSLDHVLVHVARIICLLESALDIET